MIQPSVVFKARNHTFAALLVVALQVTVKGLSFRVTVKLKLLPVGEEKKSCPRAEVVQRKSSPITVLARSISLACSALLTCLISLMQEK
jgi:hypothetical protein